MWLEKNRFYNWPPKLKNKQTNIQQGKIPAVNINKILLFLKEEKCTNPITFRKVEQRRKYLQIKRIKYPGVIDSVLLGKL
jgi:hypothetical protein